MGTEIGRIHIYDTDGKAKAMRNGRVETPDACFKIRHGMAEARKKISPPSV